MKQIVRMTIGLILLGSMSLVFPALSWAGLPSDVHPQQIWSPSPEEAKAINSISSQITTAIRAAFDKTGKKKAFRDAHAKQHGCVKAEFTVVDGLDKKNLNYGVFSTPGKTYKAWIRFSNGSGDPDGDDQVAGGRGMAIKLFGVEGPKFLDDERFTQDFQMINYPVFFVKNAIDYQEFQADPASFFGTPQKPNPLHIEEFKVVAGLGSPVVNPPKNPLESTYFSMTPRQLGPVTNPNPIKFSAAPIPCKEGDALPGPVALEKSKDALRIAMRKTLEDRDACFVFRIQTQTNETDMPVNNPVKLWDEKASPFQTVAKIVIHKQAFDGPKIRKGPKDDARDPKQTLQETFCEDLSITPWHTIAEHQPLGSIELTRKVVYQATSQLRHELNQRPKTEPTGDEDFNVEK